MLIVIDDVLDKESLGVVQGFFGSSEDARKMRWVDGDLEALLTYKSPLAQILTQVSRVFDLSQMSGVEQWAHYGTKPDWHVDKDEALSIRTGQLATPICSIVFYAEVNDLNGGKFMTDTATITPVTNRLLAFSPGMLHGVEAYTGTRMAIAVNPWVRKPGGY
jgi:hypothetical protein